MAYWLLKSEPDEWSWAQQVAEGRDGAEWTGIRNFSARNHLRAMKKGEQAFFYHTGKERAIVGIVKVTAEAHPDSTDAAWLAVNVAAVKKLPTPVSLDQIKADKRLKAMALVRLARLSVQPVSDTEWRIICQMGELG
jgi:predicted RNA-binding protein with PUA-like domain